MSEITSHGITESQLHELATRGFVSLRIQSFPSIQEGYEQLFAASGQYFALPAEHESKVRYRAASGSGASEEGHSVIPGEKQIFTCRGYYRTPVGLREQAKKVWEATGLLLEGVMSQISDDLQLPTRPFEPLLGECLKFQQQRTPTLLRLFRYDRPRNVSEQPSEVTPSQVVAERHRDLGLLSIVVGTSPGLEVFDEHTNEWISIEEPNGAENQNATPRLTITLLAGQCLRYLTRGQYRAGVHRVRCAAKTNDDGSVDPFRYSIVYALRPFPSVLNLADFEGPTVGRFTAEERAGIDGESARKLFDLLCGKHFNVNIARDIREQQRINTAQMYHHPSIGQSMAVQANSQTGQTDGIDDRTPSNGRTAAVADSDAARENESKKKTGWPSRTWQKMRPSSFRPFRPNRVSPQSS